jgi:hypothetical protein
MKFLYILFVLPSFGLHIHRREILKIAPLFLVNHEEKSKFCKDCKFFKKDFFSHTKFGHCSNFPYQQTDDYLVDGIKDMSPSSYNYCSVARSSDRMCGPEGKYFESK